MLRAGLVGLPSSGKTTLFRLMTQAADTRGLGRVAPHLGIARVPDERLDRLTQMFRPRRRVPATVELTDIAGRAGTRALFDLPAFRNADALVHVVRAFRDDHVPHPATTLDPPRDARQVEDELILADLDVVERRLARVAVDIQKGGSDDLKKEQSALEECRVALDRGEPLRLLTRGVEAAKRLKGFQLLSAKPLLVVMNLDETDVGRADQAATILGLDDFLATSSAKAVAVCAQIELEISALGADDARAFTEELGLRESGLDRVIRASYDLLGYISFFTTGEDECRAWSIPNGTSAQEAAAEIHTDIARGFIRAEVVAYAHLIARGSIAACRDAGELRLEGKEYVVRDGDVINFRFAT